jgi:hypothetical protein
MTAICVWKFLKLTVLSFLELTVAMVQRATTQHVSQFLLVLVVWEVSVSGEPKQVV